jgi:hypothetical protein
MAISKIDALDQHRLFILVGELASNRRKQEKGQNE